MIDIANVEISRLTQREFLNNGFIHVPGVLSMNLVLQLRARFESLFDGQFSTGIYPDEWHWRKGISHENAFREIVNAWKSDELIKSVVCSATLGKMACEIMDWGGARVGQDDILWKPAGASGVGYHRDSSYISKQFTPFKNSSITFWLALDDADAESGVVEYVKGSHENFDGKDFSMDFFNADNLSRYKHKSIVAPAVKAGDILCHHQDILHGSSRNMSKNTPRRAIGIHYLREDVQWAPSRKPDYIYGRYFIQGEHKPRDDFFPIVFRKPRL